MKITRMKEKFLVRYRVDTEEYFCCDEQIIESHCTSVVDFVRTHLVELNTLESYNTIIKIERIM